MFITAKIASILISFTAVHIYDFHVFSHLGQSISVSKLWVYIGSDPNYSSSVSVASKFSISVYVIT